MENNNEEIKQEENVPETEHQEPNKALTFGLNTVKGVTLGISAAIAGLSAGTIAIAEKCYDPLVNSISDLKKNFKKNFLFLLPFVLGALIGALAALLGIARGYEKAPFSLTGFFAGFIVGSIPVTLRELKRGKDKKEIIAHIVALIVFFIIPAALGILSAVAKVDLAEYMAKRVWWIYILVPVCGFIAAAACIVPGISGSMMLMVLGMYYPILYSYTGRGSYEIWHYQGEDRSKFMVTGLILAVLLVIGALLGALFASKAMKYFLAKHRVTTFYAILGLIIGSLVSMFMNYEIVKQYPTIKPWDYVTGSILFVVCAIISCLLVIYSNKVSKKN
jgi:putative membrane protein